MMNLLYFGLVNRQHPHPTWKAARRCSSRREMPEPQPVSRPVSKQAQKATGMTRSLEYVRYSMIGPVLDGCTYMTYAPKSLDTPTSTVLLELAVVAPIRARPWHRRRAHPSATQRSRVSAAAPGDAGALPDRRRRPKARRRRTESNKMKRQRRSSDFLIGHVAVAGHHGAALRKKY
jgi:hypothetical protein